jgi:serine protease Do
MRSPRFEPPRDAIPRFALAVLAAVACAGRSACFAQVTAEAPRAASPAVDPGALSTAIESLARRIAPAVVQVQVKGYAPVLGGEEGGLLARRSGAGSGVILDPAGYIVTNAHVIEGARSIQVELPAERRSPAGTSILKSRGRVLGAQLVGVDRETDLAVLKVDASGLPALRLGDSEALAPGQLVFAFGSPFGLEGSVTMGVVSSVARQVQPDHPMIYVQTDAAINPGNSGGPLADAAGLVVGINTFIFTQSGGSEGVGFAVPSNIVKNVYEQLRASGHVRRGMIGVNAQTITSALAAGLRLPRDWGVVLADVAPGGPADEAGLRIGDVVVTLDGKPMENGRQLDVNLYRRKIGDRVKLEVLRGGQGHAFTVRVVERTNDPERFIELVSPERNLVAKLGVLGLDLDAGIAQSIAPPPRRTTGVIVAASSTSSLHREEVFIPGDVIYAVNGAAVNDLAGLRRAVEPLKIGDAVVAQVERRGVLQYVAFEVE